MKTRLNVLTFTTAGLILNLLFNHGDPEMFHFIAIHADTIIGLVAMAAFHFHLIKRAFFA